jgi:hypothetical protein
LARNLLWWGVFRIIRRPALLIIVLHAQRYSMAMLMTPNPPSAWNWGYPVTNKVFRPYAIALGQLALAWNELHETLALVFCMTMGRGMVNQYLAIWHAIKVDRAQRDILLSAAKAIDGSPYPTLAADLEWICIKANAVEDARNDALHSPLFSSRYPSIGPSVRPMTGLGHVRAKKLEARDLLNEFRWCRDASQILTKFARDLDLAMSGFGLSWPDRPAWPNRGQTKRKKPRLQVRPTKPPLLPESSPP